MLMILIPVLLALLAVAAAVWAIFFGLGIFEYLGGKKKSAFPAISKATLKEKILALNAPNSPYQIIEAEKTDMVIEWKIVDAGWYGIFSKERVNKTYNAFLFLDENCHTVRYYEEMESVEWHAGTDGLKPSIFYRKEFFKGRILFRKSWGVQYGIKKSGELGKIYEYKFDIGYIRDPIKKVVEENGWEFVPVVRKKHAMF